MQSRELTVGRSQAPAAAAVGTSPGERRWLGLLVGVVLAGAAAALIATLLQPGAAHHAQRQAATVTASVTVNAGRAGRPVPRRFLGLSFELSSLSQIARYSERGDLARMLRTLGPGILRFGGASADTRVAWTDARTPRPAWASSVLRVGDLHRLRRLAAASGWRVLLTVGLAHYDPRAGAREVAAAHRALGRWLAGIEIGNEPDAYARHNFRSPSWSPPLYAAQVASYRRAIARLVAGIPLAGPGVSGSGAFARWGADVAASERPALLTGHHYPLGCHDAQTPTIERLLSEQTRRREAVSLARYVSISRASAIGLRVDETNTVSCGGRDGVSNTFASALWAVNYIAQAMAAGAVGINLQGNPANCLGYSPVCASSPARLAAGDLSAQPEWGALLLMKGLVGDRPLHSTVASQSRENLTTTALLAHDGSVHVVIVDDNPAGSRVARLSVHVGGGFRSATVLALSARSLGARTGIELGGRAIPRDGSWQAPSRLRPLTVRGGMIVLSIPPASATLVTIARSQPSR
jgi:hypothetical protein